MSNLFLILLFLIGLFGPTLILIWADKKIKRR